MSEPNDSFDRVIYPMINWRVATGVKKTKVCLLEILFARNVKEAQAGLEGGDLPGFSIGMTPNQCRQLAADLIEAANKLDGQRTMS
jgi:hypothetical protein